MYYAQTRMRRSLCVSGAGLLALVWAATASSDEPAKPPAPPPSASAPAPSASAPAAAPSAPAAPAAPASAVPAGARAGVAVVLVGPWDDTLARQARDLARAAYRAPKLRPQLDEATVRILTGGEPSADDVAGKQLSDLRARLAPDLTTEESRAGLAGLAAALPVEAIVLFVPGPVGPSVRLAHVDATKSPPSTRVDPATLAPSPKEGQPGALDLDPVLTSLERLVAPKAKATRPLGPPTGEKAKPGPRKENLKNAKPSKEPEKPKEESSWYESPWFWVAVGGVAATGLTILIVSQTTDVGQGSVALRGKVLE